MKKNLKFALILVLFCGFYQNSNANVQAIFDYKIFYVPEKGPFLEVYFDFLGTSINYIEAENGKMQGEVEITFIIKQNEEIVTFDKKLLKSPLVTDSTIVDFIDQSRFDIPKGEYIIEIILRDVNANTDEVPSEYSQKISIDAPENDIFFSGIQMVSAYKKAESFGVFTKSGMDLIPFVSDYLNPNMQEIILYAEIYNTAAVLGSDQMFALMFYIEDAGTLEKLSGLGKIMRKNTGEVIPFLQSVNLGTVHSGSYNFVLELRNKENKLLAKQKLDFERNNPSGISSEKDLISAEEVTKTFAGEIEIRDQIMDYIHGLRPITKTKEQFIINNTLNNDSTDIKILQSFFYSFWHARNPEDPERAWLEYYEKLKKVEELFSTNNKRGYETDRGRVFMVYGPPSEISDRPNEQSSYPYQIWHYYRAQKWNNVKFVFYDPMRTLRDYELLNVDYIPGEIRNPRWKIILQGRTTPQNDIDRTDGINEYGGKVDELYDNPR